MPKTKTPPSASVKAKPFGKTPDGQNVQLYTLTNRNGMRMTVATYGATLVSLYAPDRGGKMGDVSLGFATIEPYFAHTAYFGAIIGRYGNRIAKGKFSLDGKPCKISVNNPPNSLHGGVNGFDKQLWNAEVVSQDPPSVRFSRLSPDGEEGYPGNLNVAVTYTLTNRNEVRLQYTAQTDKTTIFNPTSHIYFNLAGAGSGKVHAQQIKIHAEHYTPSKKLIPTGEFKDVAGTPFDLRKMTPIGQMIHETGGTPAGYDHNFVLSMTKRERPALAAEAYDPKSGRYMKVYTDQPGVQFYTGNFLDGSLRGKGGKAYDMHDAFCLETQHFPDSPNKPEFPTTILRPGETYRSTTVYAFSAR